MLLEVKLLGVEAQEPEPELPHRLRVWLQLREEPVLQGRTHGAAWKPAAEHALLLPSARLS